MIRFTCNTCGETYEVAPKHAGKKSACAKCKSPITVPASSTVRPSPAAQPPAVPSPATATQPVSPSVHVSLDQNKPTGTQGFLRAFGITSGFMAAIAAVVLGIPILACGGCLVSMIGVGTTIDTTPSSTGTSPSQTLSSDITRDAMRNSVDTESTGSQTLSSDITRDAPSVTETKEVPIQLEPAPTETVIVESLPSVDLSGRPNVFTFDGMTATIEDQYINDVRIIDVDGDPVTVDVLLENNSGANWQPNLALEFVNAYGVVLGYDSIAWALDELAPNKRYTESVDFYAKRFDDIFRYSPIARPEDFDTPKYLILRFR